MQPSPSSEPVERLESILMSLVNDSLAGFLDLIIADIGYSSAASPLVLLARTTNHAQELLAGAQAMHGKALQMDGCRAELHNIERTQDRIMCVLHALKEVLLLAQADPRGLVRRSRYGELFYQTHSNIVPII
jgi:hypothetical protein